MAGRADDARLFVAAELGHSIRFELAAAGSRQTDDDAGAIVPGSYLVRILGLGVNTAYLRAGPFVKTETITAVIPAAVAAATSVVPVMVLTGSPEFILHVRKGVNDRLAGILSAGVAELHLTKVGS